MIMIFMIKLEAPQKRCHLRTDDLAFLWVREIRKSGVIKVEVHKGEYIEYLSHLEYDSNS